MGHKENTSKTEKIPVAATKNWCARVPIGFMGYSMHGQKSGWLGNQKIR